MREAKQPLPPASESPPSQAGQRAAVCSVQPQERHGLELCVLSLL